MLLSAKSSRSRISSLGEAGRRRSHEEGRESDGGGNPGVDVARVRSVGRCCGKQVSDEDALEAAILVVVVVLILL
jgi:hypothetical protein